LNTILADSLAYVSDQLEQQLAAGTSLPVAAASVLKTIMQDHGNVVFGGDGYSSEWHQKAVTERGLENLPTTPDALLVRQRPEVRELFEREGVLSPLELESRFEVYAEQYVLAVEVEAKLVLQIARTQIYPAVITYLGSLASSLRSQEELGLAPDRTTAGRIASLNQDLLTNATALEAALAEPAHGTAAHMRHCVDNLVPLMLSIRQAVDSLETLVDDAIWPLPSYQEMLFIR
jgi:glutamine synthetase